MKNSSLNIRSFFLLLFFAIISTSCHFKGSEYNKEIREIKSKPLVIKYPLKCYSIAKGFYNFIPNNRYKIVTYIDARCNICLNELGIWNEYIYTNTGMNVEYLIFLRINNFQEIESFLKNIDFKYSVILDEDNKFLSQNKIPNDKTLQTFLLDDTNKVLLVGNPTLNNSINNLFKDYLNVSRN